MDAMTDDGTALIARVRAVLVEVIGPERGAVIDADTNLLDNALLDSILMISFLLRVEADLDREIDFEALGLDQLRTLRTLAAVLDSGADGAGAGPA